MERFTILSIPSNRDLLESMGEDNVFSVTSVAEWERDYDAGKYGTLGVAKRNLESNDLIS